jgi:hypothetical protein
LKHLFLVHSPITYLIAVSVISDLNLSEKDAIIIFFEFQKIIQTNKYVAVSIGEFYSKKSLVKKTWNYFRYFNVIKRIDKLTDSVTSNEKFIAYVPVLLFAGKALVTHKNCVSFNFIEEGLMNYYKEETLQSITIIKAKDPWRSNLLKNTKLVLNEMYEVLRGYNFKLQALPFSYSCYNGFANILFYGFGNDSFPLVSKDKQRVVPFKKNTFSGIQQKEELDLTDQTIWIGDGAVIQHNLSQSVYIKGIERGCIAYLQQNNIQNIFVKFHRDEPASLRETVREVFLNNGINIQVIPDNIILELLLFESTNTTLIGVFSSLLYYAVVMNHSAFSIYNFLKEEYSKLFAGRDFSFYWNVVKLINPESAVATTSQQSV